MNAGALLGTIGLGAAEGALATRGNEIQRERATNEEERKNQILNQREIMKARAAERLAKIEHGYKLDEQIAKGEIDESLQKVKQTGTMEKTKYEGQNKLAVEGMKQKNNGKVDKSEKEVMATDKFLRTEYQKYLADIAKDPYSEKEADKFETWAVSAFPKQYELVYGKMEPTSKVSGFDFKGISSRVKGLNVKPGANGKPQEWKAH